METHSAVFILTGAILRQRCASTFRTSHREAGRQGDLPVLLINHLFSDHLLALAYMPQHPTVTNLHYHKTDKQRRR